LLDRTLTSRKLPTSLHRVHISIHHTISPFSPSFADKSQTGPADITLAYHKLTSRIDDYMPIMKFLLSTAALVFSAAAATTDKKPLPTKPCTIKSPLSGAFFDINPLHVELPKDTSSSKSAPVESWHSRGYDYGANFTLNFCAPVVEELRDVEGVESSLWKNVSAFYVKDRKTYSMGYDESRLWRGL
jgi:hypothetical protein